MIQPVWVLSELCRCLQPHRLLIAAAVLVGIIVAFEAACETE
jgi:hypothetical protein